VLTGTNAAAVCSVCLSLNKQYEANELEAGHSVWPSFLIIQTNVIGVLQYGSTVERQVGCCDGAGVNRQYGGWGWGWGWGGTGERQKVQGVRWGAVTGKGVGTNKNFTAVKVYGQWLPARPYVKVDWKTK